MRIGSFKNEIFIRAEVATVMNVVSDYSQQQIFHPLIIKVVQATTIPAGILKRYFITDQLRWGPFKFKIRYRADILSATADTVYAEAYQFPATHISLISEVKPAKDGILLHETFTLKAPKLFFDYAFRQAQISHAETLHRIKEYVEGVEPR